MFWVHHAVFICRERKSGIAYTTTLGGTQCPDLADCTSMESLLPSGKSAALASRAMPLNLGRPLVLRMPTCRYLFASHSLSPACSGHQPRWVFMQCSAVPALYRSLYLPLQVSPCPQEASHDIITGTGVRGEAYQPVHCGSGAETNAVLVQAINGRPSSGRESEQACLLAQLRQAPKCELGGRPSRQV